MKNKQNEQSKTELQQLKEELNNRPALPTGEEIQQHAEKDIQAAIAFLRLILDHPNEFKIFVHTIYQEINQQERETVVKLENQIKAMEELENVG